MVDGSSVCPVLGRDAALLFSRGEFPEVAEGCPYEFEPGCDDSDVSDAAPDGIDPLVAGQCVSWKANGSGVGSPDYCIRTNDGRGLLQEARCDGLVCDRPKHGVPCPEGFICRAGACLEGDPTDPWCVDEDGEDVFRAAEVLGPSPMRLPDQCAVSKRPDAGPLDVQQLARCQAGGEEYGSDFPYCGVHEAICGPREHPSWKFFPCENGCAEGACTPSGE